MVDKWKLCVSVAALLKEIDSLAEDYLNNVRTMSGEMRKEHLTKIEKLFSKSKEFGDDKVQLAMQTYEMVRVRLRTDLGTSVMPVKLCSLLGTLADWAIYFAGVNFFFFFLYFF